MTAMPRAVFGLVAAMPFAAAGDFIGCAIDRRVTDFTIAGE